MQRADAALVISIVSATISVVGLFWQLTLYRLSGSRLRVRLRPALVNDSSVVWQGPQGGFGAEGSRNVDPFGEEVSPWVIELAHIQVTNVGRTAVSVEDISVVFGRVGWSSTGRRTMSGLPVSLLDGRAENFARLDAGESVSLFFDFWALADAARKRDAGVLVVRGSATPAGKRARLSPRRHAWRLPPDRTALRQSAHTPPDSELRAFLALWRTARVFPEDLPLLSGPWFAVRTGLAEADSPTDLAQRLDVLPERARFVVALATFQAYHDE